MGPFHSTSADNGMGEGSTVSPLVGRFAGTMFTLALVGILSVTSGSTKSLTMASAIISPILPILLSFTFLAFIVRNSLLSLGVLLASKLLFRLLDPNCSDEDDLREEPRRERKVTDGRLSSD